MHQPSRDIRHFVLELHTIMLFFRDIMVCIIFWYKKPLALRYAQKSPRTCCPTMRYMYMYTG